MATAVKERITFNLQKAKEEGGLRVERIREIVKDAVMLSVDEIKGGSGEIRTIASDAIAAVIDLLKERGQDAKADVAASVEGVIDGIKASRQAQLHQTQAQVEQLQTQLEAEHQQLDAELDSALVTIETTAQESNSSADFKALFASVIKTIRDSKQFAQLQEQYAQLRAQLATLDGKLAERYGDRYDHVKQQLEKYWETAKAWYEQTRADVQAGGVNPIQKMQTELGEKFAAAGTAAAKTEQATKERLGEMLKKEAECEVTDPE